MQASTDFRKVEQKKQVEQTLFKSMKSQPQNGWLFLFIRVSTKFTQVEPLLKYVTFAFPKTGMANATIFEQIPVTGHIWRLDKPYTGPCL